MKRLNVDIDDEVYEARKALAEEKNVTVAQILGNYANDLTGIHSNGSDERMYAEQYFNRTWLSWMNLEY